MKKILLLLCLLLILPVTTEANYYINYKHNFQITLPLGWYSIAPPGSELPSVGTTTSDGTIAGIVITIEEMGFKETYNDFSADEINDLALEIIQALGQIHPDISVQSTQFTYLNNQQALIIHYTYKMPDSKIKMQGIITTFAHNYQLYNINLETNDTTSLYKQIYWQTCASFSFLQN